MALTQKTMVSQQSDSLLTWQRREDESFMWYNRFKTYLNLGPKRSLRAAVQASIDGNELQIVPRSTEKQALTIVTSDEVPGSWKSASSQFQWVARASAWDNWVKDRIVEKTINETLEGLAFSLHRITALQGMATKIQTMLNHPDNNFTPEQMIGLLTRLQVIIRDIREEARIFNREDVRKTLRRKADIEYGTEKFPSNKNL